MKLRQLLQGIDGLDVRGKKDVEIAGLSSDSRVVAPGHLFIAKKGQTYDGGLFIEQAIASGAKAVLTDMYDPFLNLTQIICGSVEEIEPLLAAKFYGHPSKQMFVVGVTGSKGKTTTSYLIHHLLESLHHKCGLVSTVETRIGEMRFDSRYTTEGVIQNQKFLKEMLLQGCKDAVLEVSSHGLAQNRVKQISFNVGVFTNLYPDHLDYHKTMDEYAKAKAKLFDAVTDLSIFNGDSPWSSLMKRSSQSLSIGIESEADLRATDICLEENGVSFFVQGVLFKSSLMGLFNVYNLLCAIAVGVFLGVSLQQISFILSQFPGVPGRLQRVPNTFGKHVFIDYAHTGKSLNDLLVTLKPFAKQRLIVVFGCGGNRDPNRRKEMAYAAQQYADFSIITTDNSRSEDPEKICQEILEGYTEIEKREVILDRKEAIFRAIALANPGDFVVIAGKGHEKVQIFSHQTVTFDDMVVARDALKG